MFEPRPFAGLTEEHCRMAWRIVKPSIKEAHKAGLLNKHAGSVVVLRPGGQTGEASKFVQDQLTCALAWGNNPDDPSLEEVADRVLFISRVGDQIEDKYTYFALKKALLADRVGMPSGDVRHLAPWRMQPGDIKHQGGVTENGLTIGFSGVQSEYDEAIAWTMVSWLQAITRREMAALVASDHTSVLHP